MFSFIRKQKHKNNKLLYYIKSVARYYTPQWFCRKQLPNILAQLEEEDKEYILQRVNYYNKLAETTPITLSKSIRLLDFTRKNQKKGSAYFFDTYEYTRFFPSHLRFVPLFGDITEIPDTPSITKSRPIKGNNANSVLLNLNKNRHFLFINDPIPFSQKEHKIIFRGDANGKSGRIRFFQKWFGHPACDLVDTASHSVNPAEWKGTGISIEEHLKYRYILTLEGVDVATNLKWVMSSNCIAVMPRPTYETWFMEGTLIPNYHYIEIKPDYSDLLERTQYYTDHPEEAEAIIQHAHEYVEQFRNRKREKLISLMVLEKYFRMTGQSLRNENE